MSENIYQKLNIYRVIKRWSENYWQKIYNNLSNKILEYSDDEYMSINFSKIYFSIEDFKKEQRKTTKKVLNDKKIQEK